MFVDQSGTFPKTFDDFDERDILDREERAKQLAQQALQVECGIPLSASASTMWRILGGLGTHDISAMREALGIPSAVLGVHTGFPFWRYVRKSPLTTLNLTTSSVMFQYPGFVVNYESGINQVPRFDAHIEVYGENKIVRIQYDTPYVKGLPITLHVSENVDGALRETVLRETYEDPYTQELKRVYEWMRLGTAIKTTIEDARLDIEIFQMIMKADHRNKASNCVV